MVKKCVAGYLFRMEELLIFVGYVQPNIYLYVTLNFLRTTCMTLAIENMHHLGAGHIFIVLTRVFARFQQSCTLKALLQIFGNRIGSFSQTLYWAQLTEGKTTIKHPPFFFSISYKIHTKSHVTHIKYVFCHFVVYLFKNISCCIYAKSPMTWWVK